MNSSDLLLLSKCAKHDLLVINTTFRQDVKYKTMWVHPRSKQWHLINYVITRQRDSGEVLITRTMRRADSWTDHKLVRAKLNMHIIPQHRKRPELISLALNTARLLTPRYQQELQASLDEKFDAASPLTGGPEEKWNQLKEVVTETAKTCTRPKEEVPPRLV